MTTTRRRFAWVAFACAMLAGIGPAAAAPQPRIVFGCALSLSGSLAAEGKLTREGYDFWQRYVSAHGGLHVGGTTYAVEIRYADDESVPANTARAVETLIADQHVDFLLRPYASRPTSAASAVAEKHHVPMPDSGGAA